jgi:hypothetical protein
MSGAAGHLQHLHENRQLKLGEIKDVIRWAADGKLKNVTEKLDGMNLMFTWNVKEGQLRVARNTSDVKNGGIDLQTLAKRFNGRQNVEEAFTSAFKVLNEALSHVADDTKRRVFGSWGQLWYSMEVILKDDHNVIKYNSNAIVLHKHPVYRVTEFNSIELEESLGSEMLAFAIHNSKASLNGWTIYGPATVRLKKMNEPDASLAITEIALHMKVVGANDDDTLESYLQKVLRITVKAMSMTISKEIEDMIVMRVSGVLGAPTIVDIKKRLPKQKHDAAATLVKNAERLQKEALFPIEMAIQTFAIKLLSNVDSGLVSSPKEEIERLRTEVAKAVKAIRDSKNEAALEVLDKELRRLGDTDNVSSTVEGIVFEYKNEMYKFTGAFAPAHQILALFKYGRKGIPKMAME